MVDYSIKLFNKYTDHELIDKVIDYSRKSGKEYITCREFCSYVGISESTIDRHFGSWSIFCNKAGLNSRYMRGLNKDELFENLEEVWLKLGRQPRAKEMKQPLSKISISRYQKEFKKDWYEICCKFLAWKSGTTADEIREANQLDKRRYENDSQITHKTNRTISLSLRYDVLKRDNFKCVKCGRTPANNSEVQLHVDHVIPWSRGGETVVDNLQTLCAECNYGKSNKIE